MWAIRKLRWLLLMGGVLISGCAAVVTPAGSLQAPARPPTWGRLSELPVQGEPGGLLTQAEFAGDLALEMERLSPGGTAVNHSGEVVELWVGQTPGVSLPVGPVYQAYRGQPEDRLDVIRQAVHQAMAIHAVAATWETAKAYLLPQLLPLGQFAALDQSGAMPVNIQISDELFLVFDLRVDGVAVPVHQGFQAAWGMTSSDIYQQAMANLAHMTPDLAQGADGVSLSPTWLTPQADRLTLYIPNSSQG